MTCTGVAAVRDGDVDAYVTDFPTLQWYANRQPCDLSVQGDNFGPGMLVYGLQKGSPFTQPLNAAMLQVCNATAVASGPGRDRAPSLRGRLIEERHLASRFSEEVSSKVCCMCMRNGEHERVIKVLEYNVLIGTVVCSCTRTGGWTH